MELFITQTGGVRCLYGESIDLSQLGELEIRRASNVEPDEAGRWWADLAPVEGPKLGPFSRRSEALDSEVEWLVVHGVCIRADMRSVRTPNISGSAKGVRLWGEAGTRLELFLAGVAENAQTLAFSILSPGT